MNEIYKLGKNAKNNHELISNANPNDWWFHLADYPSAHCIVSIDKLERENIVTASLMIKKKSKYKSEKVNIIYTRISNIRMTNILGEVVIIDDKKVKSIAL